MRPVVAVGVDLDADEDVHGSLMVQVFGGVCFGGVFADHPRHQPVQRHRAAFGVRDQHGALQQATHHAKSGEGLVGQGPQPGLRGPRLRQQGQRPQNPAGGLRLARVGLCQVIEVGLVGQA